MRLFLAIELGPQIIASLAQMQARLKESGGDVRFVDPEHFHLTVLFLGEMSDEQLPGILDAGKHLSSATKNFRIGVGGASYFPKRGPLKTLWVGLTEGAHEWTALAQSVEPWFVPMGVARAHSLAPHITLGRVRSPLGEDALRGALDAEKSVDCGWQWARGLTLIESFLGPGGAMYQNRAFWPFLESAATNSVGTEE